MNRTWMRRAAIGFAAWLPFFVLWTGVSLSFGQVSLWTAVTGGLISMGTAGLLGIAINMQ